jgi:hypothetical protein
MSAPDAAPAAGLDRKGPSADPSFTRAFAPARSGLVQLFAGFVAVHWAAIRRLPKFASRPIRSNLRMGQINYHLEITMNRFSCKPLATSSLQRGICICAAGSASATALGALLALFSAASPDSWLPDTPEATVQAAICDHVHSRPARAGCIKEVLARWEATDRREVIVASSR